MEKHYVFSAPGRTEISGNHTDHQCGCVLAAAVNLETVADVRLNGTNNIWVQSEGYPTIKVNLDDLSVHEEEKNTTAALIRGVASSFVQRGSQFCLHTDELPQRNPSDARVMVPGPAGKQHNSPEIASL